MKIRTTPSFRKSLKRYKKKHYSPKVKSNLPHLLGSDSTKLSLVAPSED